MLKNAVTSIKAIKIKTVGERISLTVFANAESSTIAPDPEDVAGFQVFIERYKAGLAIERAAVENLK